MEVNSCLLEGEQKEGFWDVGSILFVDLGVGYISMVCL